MNSKDVRVLVADDDDDCRDWVVAHLGGEGFTCTGVSTAAEAVTALKSDRYDLLVSDIKMPGNNDLELVRALSGATYGVPVILMTAHPSVNTAVPAVGLHVVSYLIKPFSPEVLIQHSKEVVEREQALTTLREKLGQLESWNGDLRTGVANLQTKGGPSQTVDTFFSVTLTNIVSAMSDVSSVMRTLAAGELTPEAAHALEASRPASLLAAMHDTVRSLKRARVNIKSQDLENQLERLETLLQEINAVRPGPKPLN